jgi:methylenetetrahydrofolate--tRNA-(uracil-5-)-methyltransferase
LRVTVVGAGLAGCEAAWQAARRGLDVVLYEMRPQRFSAAHASAELAELVCSNSLRSNELANAVGLLKQEMRRAGSLVMAAADESAVPAGRALAVDRAAFARRITDAIESHPRIELRREVVTRVPQAWTAAGAPRAGEDRGPAILATGPLTACELADDLQRLLGEEYLYFYDALSPIVYADSIDCEVAFRASRYGEGEGDYLNLPLDRGAYEAFVEAVRAAETVPLHPCERALFFEGCLPIEELARRGRDTLAHGPMKPVGLVDPRSGRRPYAVVQLRQEDKRGILYSLVGFQTRMRIASQKRVLRGLPGLAGAAFARYGSVHRNTYVNAPRHLRSSLELRSRPGVLLAGQMAGVEGYVESAALGGIAGVNAAFLARGEEPPLPDAASAHGALLRYLLEADPRRFQPMNVNYGLFPPLEGAPRRGRRERGERLAARGLDAFGAWVARAAALVS